MCEKFWTLPFPMLRQPLARKALHARDGEHAQVSKYSNSQHIYISLIPTLLHRSLNTFPLTHSALLTSSSYAVVLVRICAVDCASSLLL